MRLGTHLGTALRRSRWRLWHAGPPRQIQHYRRTGISQSHQTETPLPALHPWTLPPPQFSSVLACFCTNIHSLITDKTTNHILLAFLAPFSSLPSLFYCYAFSLINRCLFVSGLWFAEPSPPYGSGEAILDFLVLQFSQECNFLGKRKKKKK